MAKSKLDNFKGKGNTAGFKQNPENINRGGRPRKIAKLCYNQDGLEQYKDSELRQVFALQMAMTEDEIQALIDDPNSEMIDKIVARSLIKAKAKGDIKYAELLLDHVMGKPKTTSEIKMDMDMTIDGMRAKANKYQQALKDLKKTADPPPEKAPAKKKPATKRTTKSRAKKSNGSSTRSRKSAGRK